jgi:hypothetical protein
VRLPDGSTLAAVDFERHVAPLLGKAGCSTGACHGSFQGKGGLRLSLFGHDPQKDFLALSRGGMGRRVDVADPDRSLLLLKASGQVAHGGRKRFDRHSWTYAIFRAWIAGGCCYHPGTGRVTRLEIIPGETAFSRPGQSAALRVQVTYTDGTAADVTPFCDFRVKDDSIAEVTPHGLLRGLAPGDTPVIVGYRGELAAARVLVPAQHRLAWPEIPTENFIDAAVFAKLRRLNILPSDLASDAEFLRRVTIDTTGSLPGPAEVRAFLADPRSDKRRRKIDELLAHPLRAALWATRLCDITGCSVETMDTPPELRAKYAKLWHDWFRTRLAANVGFDRIAHGVLCATTREEKDVPRWVRQEAAVDQALRKGFDAPYAERAGLDLYWRREKGEDFFPLEQMAELTAAAFLGVRLECAQCHKHPFDRWTQADYRAFANVFAQVHYGSSPETTAAVADYLEARRSNPAKAGPPLSRVQEVYVDPSHLRRLSDPETGGLLPARAPAGPTIPYDGDARETFCRWLTRPDNPFFARNAVNRVWAHYFGTGLVEPVDGFSVANPPSNEPLLDALAGDFTAHGYDLRRLERLILQSRTYQLSAVPNATNARDRTNHSHAQARPMLAEAVVDVLNDALGTREDLGPDAPPGRRAVEVATNRVQAPHLARLFRVFGRPPRAAACDCERPHDPALPQTLFLMTDPVLLDKIRTGRLARLLAAGRSDDEIVEELFLASLSRLPDAPERRAALDHVRGAADRKAALADVVWALINTREFILNH